MGFLDNISNFSGTGEKNQAGQDLEEFLEKYDPKKYDCPSNTVDIIVVRSEEPLKKWGQPLKVLMVKRSNHPSIGYWALPGGFVEIKENLEDAAARELEEETGVKDLPLQQVYTWGNYDRDPRWRVITTAFLAFAEGDIPVKAGDDAADAVWMDVSLQEEPGDVWHLQLNSREVSAALTARVKVTTSAKSILPQPKYELLTSDGIASDYGCIIIQALYLKKLTEA